ncbi:hypothetical protein ABKN59_008676 [Abortiporus biennis]
MTKKGTFDWNFSFVSPELSSSQTRLRSSTCPANDIWFRLSKFRFYKRSTGVFGGLTNKYRCFIYSALGTIMIQNSPPSTKGRSIFDSELEASSGVHTDISTCTCTCTSTSMNKTTWWICELSSIYEFVLRGFGVYAHSGTLYRNEFPIEDLSGMGISVTLEEIQKSLFNHPSPKLTLTLTNTGQ